MSELETIEALRDGPNTVSTLAEDFRKAGIRDGMTLLVHSSLSSLGWVCGGAHAVILALEEVLGEKGNLVMPAHSGDLSDPADWSNPPVPESWWDTIRTQMPAFDPDLTPTRGMGKIAETFRKQAGTFRSGHPLYSFTARGKQKDFILQDSHYDNAQNDRSPLGRIYGLDAYVLLLGVDYTNNTSFHLAEYRATYPGKETVSGGFPIIENGVKVWKEFDDIDYHCDDFPVIGEAFEKTGQVAFGNVGLAKTRVFSQRAAVDFAVKWMEENRSL